MTSLLAKTAHDMKILTKTLQNHIIREAFAKNRMSKALSVQKKIGHGRTDTHTHTHTHTHTDLSINYMTRANARRPVPYIDLW